MYIVLKFTIIIQIIYNHERAVNISHNIICKKDTKKITPCQKQGVRALRYTTLS